MGSTEQLHPGWAIQLAVHRSVRRDLGRLARGLAADDPASPGSLCAYWDDFASALHHHHELEDRVIWPLMGERLGREVDPVLAVNAGEHAAMSTAMDDFEATLAGVATDAFPAREALARLSERVLAHLEHEESAVIPSIPDAFNADDVAFFQAESAKVDPPARFLPWVLDDADDDVAAFFGAALPTPVSTLLESEWTPHRRMRLDAPGLTGRMGVVAALEEAYAEAERLVLELTEDQLDDASPNPGWDVRTTLNHVLGTMRMFTVVNRGGHAREDAGDLVGMDPLGALHQGATENLAAWRDPGAFEGDRSFPFGTFPAEAAAVMNLSEVVVHTWDVAMALGRGVRIGAATARLLLDFYSSIPLDDYRAHGAFGLEVVVASDAPDADRFLALLGRAPL